MTDEQWTALIDRDERYRAVYEKTQGRAWVRADMPENYKPGTLPDIRPCLHLGARVGGQPCGSPLLYCDLFGDITTRFTPCVSAQRCCNGCEKKTITTAVTL